MPHNARFKDMSLREMTDTEEIKHSFHQLTPDYVLQAVEAQGFITDGRMLALNSYENRVYQVGIEDSEPVVVKFYRPERWTNEQIQEEQDFTFELLEQELPVVTPLRNADNKSLLQYEQMRLSIFPRKGGRAPELDNPDNLHTLGQCLGRMHRVGQARDFEYRPSLTWQSYGEESLAFVVDNMIPDNLRDAYQSLGKDLLKVVQQRFDQCSDLKWIRSHADCHIGNILWRDDASHFVDFDDARMAPAMQDLWMFLSGERYEQVAQLEKILDGYEMFNSFDTRELQLIEPLRTLRMMHHCAWLARRWDDPAFPKHFPWFNTERYWGEHILQLREQFALLQEPALQLTP